MSDTPVIPIFPFAKATIALFGASAAVAAGGAAAAMAFGATLPEASIAVAATVVCLIGSLAALGPVYKASLIAIDRVAMAALSGMAIRLGVALVGGLGLVELFKMPTQQVAGWIIGCYLVLLIVDVMILVRYIRAVSAVLAAGRRDPAGNHHAEAPA